MRYLITTNVQEPFFTEWFDADNHFNDKVKMIVFDFELKRYTDDGKVWKEIEEDHL